MKKIFLCGLLLMILSCNSQIAEQKGETDLNKIKQMEWVIGDWQNLSNEGNLYESWTKTNDSTYAGKSFMIVNKDTVFSEKVSLELRNNDLYYIAAVNDQNTAQPVSFKFHSVSNGEIIFENKEHDFPQRVIYKNSQPDSLYARIEGNENGKFRQEEFRMSKNK